MTKLKELMDRPYNWNLGSGNPNNPYYDFVTDDGRNFQVDMSYGQTGEYHIVFSDFTTNPYGSTDITGKGDQFRIFATIKEIILDFIEGFTPEVFFFSAKEPSRKKLYQMFARQIEKITDFTFSVDKDGMFVFENYRD